MPTTVIESPVISSSFEQPVARPAQAGQQKKDKEAMVAAARDPRPQALNDHAGLCTCAVIEIDGAWNGTTIRATLGLAPTKTAHAVCSRAVRQVINHRGGESLKVFKP